MVYSKTENALGLVEGLASPDVGPERGSACLPEFRAARATASHRSGPPYDPRRKGFATGEWSARHFRSQVARKSSAPNELDNYFEPRCILLPRSEERRVGKECRSRWS